MARRDGSDFSGRLGLVAQRTTSIECSLRARRIAAVDPAENRMTNQTLVIVTGLALAAGGHTLLHNFLGAAKAWVRADQRFPAAMRSSPSFAGTVLLLLGALFVLVPVCG